MKSKINIWTEKDKIVKRTNFTENKTDYIACLKNAVNLFVA
jgi:hypothetical protein